MGPGKYEYQSEFAKHFLSQGKAEVVLKQLALRFGPLPDGAQERVCMATASQLDALTELVLTANSLEDVLAVL